MGEYYEEVYNRPVSSNIEDAVRTLLKALGEDPNREGLLETPERVAKAWLNFWAAGYNADEKSLYKVFETDANLAVPVMVANIPVYSHCEHHLAPIVGKAVVYYMPREGKIIGLSKINRVVDMFARRLQVQERLTLQIAESIATNLCPKGVFVGIKARHLCVESRGVNQNSVTTTFTSAGTIPEVVHANLLQTVEKMEV